VTGAEIIAVIIGFFKFFDTVAGFIKTLEKTPIEKHQDLLKASQDEAKKFEDTGRPTWE
jgi:hypothetical protein